MSEAHLLPLVNVVTVFDGEEVIETLNTKSLTFDLLLLDLNMPRMSGKEVLATLQEELPLPYTKIIVLSNSDHGKDIQECYRLEAHAYVQKPANFNVLVEFCEVMRKSIETFGNISIDFLKREYPFIALKNGTIPNMTQVF